MEPKSRVKKPQIESNVFDEMGVYWSEIADANYTSQQTQFIKSSVFKEGLVLDLACGNGRYTNPLTVEGFSIVGVDASRKLLKIAHTRSPQSVFVLADIRFLPFSQGAFASALSMDTSFGYLPSEDADLQSLKELRTALKSGGLLVLDVFNRERMANKYREDLKGRVASGLEWSLLPLLLRFKGLGQRLLLWCFKWKEYPSFCLLQKRTVSADGGRLCDLWVVYDKATGQMRLFRHSIHLYGLSQLKGLLEKAGFAVKGQYGSYSRETYSADSSRLIVLANTKQGKNQSGNR
jgi:SAM-dependent methyltransferase